MSVGDYSCNSLITSEGSKSTLLTAFFIAYLCHRFTAETKSVVKCRETQPSFEADNVVIQSRDFRSQAL